MEKTLRNIFRIVLPLVLGAAILWWMYRGFRWEEIEGALRGDMRWGWMLLSFPFGISAQAFRGLRWRQMLEPMDEHPRRCSCVNAIFLSYASSLVIPRIGELLRCGYLSRYEGTKMSRSVGTVVTERLVDIVLILAVSLLVVLWQVPLFVHFMNRTGMSVQSVLSGFSLMGYLVTALCLVLILAMVFYLLRRFRLLGRSRQVLADLRDGLLSVRHVRNKSLFAFYTLGIWVSYYLHFYLTFFCFSYTEHLSPMVALVAFIVGSFAVVVPTPNGAGSWHFAVKTVLMLYGVASTDGAMFVLIVHSIQTLLVGVLGVLGVLWMMGTTRKVS
ncbi:MAG: flippase-like domain-containing protein [Bacteroidaceae bacterium]|nr:flippase-like domain-containing protein [Bacteroidaceae bacterium]